MIHPTAVVAEEAKVGEDVHLGPYVVVEKGAEIGARTVIHTGTYIGAHVKIGADCILYPRVVLWERVELCNRVVVHSGAVIGMDGYGYYEEQAAHQKIPQIGTVVIEDDVQVGAEVTIDRARFGKTLIKKGTKLDNLVHIAHNVALGENCSLGVQCGIAGSTRVGNNVQMGEQVGVVGHIEIGDNVVIGAKSGVPKSIYAGQTYSGEWARPQEQAMLEKLPEILEELKRLKNNVERKMKNQVEPREKVPKDD